MPEESAEPRHSKNPHRKKKPLSIYFKEAVGLLEKSEKTESDGEGEDAKLKNRLKKLEVELRNLNDKRKDEKKQREDEKEKKEIKKKNEAEAVVSLAGLFRAKTDSVVPARAMDNTALKRENPEVYTRLSPDMEVFLKYLYEKGYFKGSNFLPKKGFDITCFENSYARDFVKHAAQQFGKDNQEIAKWLSGSDLKTVALFGCPNLSKTGIFAAKRLRQFFNIQENLVCSKCSLKASCKFPNQSVRKGDTKNLNLEGVMKLITLYALESGPAQLVVPEEIKASVIRLLKEVTRLSETVPSGDSLP